MSVLNTAPWLRAPALLLRRSPGVFVAVLAASAVLSTAAASASLFLASTGTAALHNEASLSCPEASQPAITDDANPTGYATPTQAGARLTTTDTTVRRALRANGVSTTTLVATSSVPLTTATDRAFLYYRANARAHVTVLRHGSGPGVWVPTSFAAARHLRIGSTIPLGSARVAVTGVYRDLAPSAFVPLFHLPRYWCSWTDAIVPTPFSRPDPMLLPDLATLQRSASVVTATWYDPTPITGRTVPDARAALATFSRTAGRLSTARFRMQSQLGSLIAKADRSRAGLRGPVLPIAIAGTLVAALLVAASGTFWGVRRARELALLRSRGVGRTALGGKAALEALPALTIGTMLGWAAAIWLVRTVGPSPLLEPGAPTVALRVSAVIGVLALLTVAVTGARTVAGDAKPTRRGRLVAVPWEVALLAAGVFTYLRVRHGGVRIVKATVQLDPLVIAFPLLALTGAVLLLGRAQWIALRRKRIRTALPTAAYLAARRIVGTPAVAVGVLIGVALPVSVLIYSSALAGSTSADLIAKYQTNVGADYAFGTLAKPGSTPRVDGTATIVSMIQVDPYIDGHTEVRVLGLDPHSFARFAFRGGELRNATTRLLAPGSRIPALLVNAPTGTRATNVTIRSTRVPIRVVGTRASFPGLRDPYEPLIVVDRARLPKLDPMTDRTEEMWTTAASVGRAVHALQRSGVDANYQITPKSFLDNTGLRPVTWLFGYLRALAYLSGAVAVTGLSFAFTARIRRRALAYHLARRMGLAAATHRRSLGLEVGALIAVGWACGVALAVAAVGLVYRLTDAYPNFPPPPAFPDMSTTVLATAGALAVVTAAAAYALQWLIDRTSAVQLLRT